MPRKLTIEEMQSLARKRGGKCLSKRYVNSQTKLRWECAKGHEWKSSPASVRYGAWCPACGRIEVRKKLSLSIDQMHAIAKKHGGKCLSKKYVNKQTKLEWQCKSGHQWEATASSVKHQGCWCPTCGRKSSGRKRALGIEKMRALAKKHGGKCLSRKYVNGHTKLEWECGEGHRWNGFPNDVVGGHWCAECAGVKRLTIERMQSVAKERGGKCLSKRYVNKRFKLQWECGNGHRWKGTAGDVLGGHWCPKCSSGIAERICRAYFQQLFGKKFPKSRPKWLRNSRGKQMELDGFCKEISVAFEHHGQQHYARVDLFHKKHSDFAWQQKKDAEKQQLCEQHGIRLIEIRRLFYETKLEEFQQFIYDECKRLHIRRPAGMLKKKINIKRAWLGVRTKVQMQRMHSIARKNGGKCLSNLYINNATKLQWECSQGHRWMAAPNAVAGGIWCTECSGYKKHTIEKMQSIAKDRGGRCLSKRYVNAHTKLEWECEKGHRWKAKPNSVKNNGSWCRICGNSIAAKKTRLCIEEMQSLAKKQGGRCLSKRYVNAHTKLMWECAEGHKWEAKPLVVKYNGSWCKRCAGIAPPSISDFKAIAKERGGRCLSKKYVRSDAKLSWECEEGHRWDATAASVKGGSWCPACSGNKKLTIEQMQSLAMRRGGKCLSKQYVNNSTKLKWQCASGHRWMAQPHMVKNDGTWCPKCAHAHD